ncbi:hypothetical protein CEP48_00325 [Mergibacter septicus]|uniref:Uncharacterized protein n=1 Tax=Mergibacter septicus TaxID=221402 RepID=A0A8D4IWL0_9PAST|nr:hypothetical protein [Mergibacter septicus]AWX14726.1 hypothetical protein CEP47_00325 [Mergibacter septicus]QDJ13977.1 hypothetical protein CEP48_00325 [Mergibacter septicus]UTU48574.1 hypothetical protein HLL31_07305 [Mergibacter septicus]WMR95797.1 hypothetical protein RDJ12_07695 [Mergibacter septicus]
MKDVTRIAPPMFPDGISIGVTDDKNIVIVDFLSRKILSKKDSSESIFSVALTKKHLRALLQALEDMENDET